MDQNLKSRLRPAVEAWIKNRYSDSEELGPTSGQRFVYRTGDRVTKLLTPLDDTDVIRCRREVDFLSESSIEGLPTALTPLEPVEIDDRTFYWYEETWIDAPSLHDVLDASGPSLDLGNRVLGEGLRILSGLHEHSVVHRDISSGNILVNDDSVFAVDLGLAKYLDLDPITGPSDQLKMTWQFASPEQLQGGHSVLSPATDIYSMALVAIFAFSKQLAFLQPGEQLPGPDYLARMAYKDVKTPLDDLPEVLVSMLDPFAALRPSADQALAEL